MLACLLSPCPYQNIIMKSILAIFCVGSLSIILAGSCNSDSSKKTTTEDTSKPVAEFNGDNKMRIDTNTSHMETTNSMSTMMDHMKSMSMTGDFDVDFASMMIEHHQGAVNMSDEELKNGKDESLKTMAQKIITAQKEEITKLQEFVKSYKPSGMKHGEGELHKSMMDMGMKMDNMKNAADADKNFSMQMSMHHESAVVMAKMELKNGMSAQLKKMATKMISDQTKEIAELKKRMSAHQ